MKNTYPLLGLGLVLALSASLASAQTSSGGRAGAMVYSGGGIRGAQEQPADGWLVTPAEAVEYQGEQGFNETPMLRPRAVVPLIDILKPEPAADLKVKAPFAIAVGLVLVSLVLANRHLPGRPVGRAHDVTAPGTPG